MAYFKFAHNDPHAFNVLFGNVDPDQKIKTKNQYRAWMTIQLPTTEAVEAGSLVGDPDVLTHIYWASVHGVTSLSLSGNMKEGLDAAELFDAVFSSLQLSLEVTNS